MKHSPRSFPLLLLAAGIHNANAAALPEDDRASTARNSEVSIPVLENDSSNLEGGSELSIIEVTEPSNGSAYAYGGRIVYIPNEDYAGEDTFTYEVVDESGYGGFATVYVTVGGTMEPYATGRTNKAIAGMLDRICQETGGGEGEGEVLNEAMGSACNQLFGAIAQDQDINQQLREIAPEEALTQRGLLSENSRNKTSRLYRGIASMRAGDSASVSVNGTALPFGGAAGDSLGSPWTLLSSIQIENFEHDASDNESGYDSDAKGLMLGLGYRASAGFNVGGAFDWMSYDVAYDGNSGDLDSDIYSLTGFLSWYRNALGLDLQVGYSTGDTKAQRRFSIIEQSAANSDYGSDQLDASAQLDWTWQLKSWALRPFLRVDYLKSNIDAFNETGDATWLVAAEKQTHEQANTSAGLDTSFAINYSWGVMTPGVRLSLVNQANLSNSPVAFQLLNAETELGRFELRADSPDSLFYQWDLTTAFTLANGLSTFIGGQLLSGYDGVSAYQVNGGVNWEF